MPLADCHLIDLPRVPNVLGNLSFIEGERHVPFAIQRVTCTTYRAGRSAAAMRTGNYSS